MRKNIRKLFVNGYGWTGSSALIDCLLDYKNISVIPNEFDDLRVPYGFIDKVKMKIAKLEGGQPKSFSTLADFEPNNIKPISSRNRGRFFILKMLLRAFHIPIPFTKMWKKPFSYRKYFFFLFFKYSQEFFVTKSFLKRISRSKSIEELNLLPSQWIDTISSIYAGKNNIVCFDQPVLIDNVYEYVNLINDVFFVVVIRKPEKQFADILERNVSFLHNYTWNVRYLFGVGDNDLKDIIKVFVNSTSNRLDQLINLKKEFNNKFLLIDFDDFLDNPEVQINKISKKIGITLKRKNKLNFNIDKSRERNRLLSIDNADLSKIISSLNEKYLKLKSYNLEK